MGVLDWEGNRTFASSSTDNQVCDPLQENQLNFNLGIFCTWFAGILKQYMYVNGPTGVWLKSWCHFTHSFVIAKFTFSLNELEASPKG